MSINHKLTAETLTGYHDNNRDWSPVDDSEVFALAQVHATLALVEQQERLADATDALASIQKATAQIAFAAAKNAMGITPHWSVLAGAEKVLGL